MCDRRCLTTACPIAALAPCLVPRRRVRRTNRVLRRRARRCARMPPARAAPDGRRRERSWPAATLQLACALAPRSEARASGACRGRGGPPLGREQSGGGQRRRAAQVGPGAARGAAPPHQCRPRLPRASPTLPKPSEDLPAALAGRQGRGAPMYRGKPSKRNAAAGGRPIGKKALQRLEELPDRAKYQRALRRRRAAST